MTKFIAFRSYQGETLVAKVNLDGNVVTDFVEYDYNITANIALDNNSSLKMASDICVFGKYITEISESEYNAAIKEYKNTEETQTLAVIDFETSNKNTISVPSFGKKIENSKIKFEGKGFYCWTLSSEMYEFSTDSITEAEEWHADGLTHIYADENGNQFSM